MRRVFCITGLVGAAVLVSACVTPATWNNADALAARRLEIQVSHYGEMLEIEHHIDPAAVPAAVRQAMDALHPGGEYIDAEKETHGGITYYELNRMVGGMEVEAMFTADGSLHSEEIQVSPASVPARAQSAAAAAVPGGSVTAWEEIRNAGHFVHEYHAKMAHGDTKWKVSVSTGGRLLGVWREVVAEIEVPR